MAASRVGARHFQVENRSLPRSGRFGPRARSVDCFFRSRRSRHPLAVRANTAWSAVRNRLYPGPRERNFTRASLCPLFFFKGERETEGRARRHSARRRASAAAVFLRVCFLFLRVRICRLGVNLARTHRSRSLNKPILSSWRAGPPPKSIELKITLAGRRACKSQTAVAAASKKRGEQVCPQHMPGEHEVWVPAR